MKKSFMKLGPAQPAVIRPGWRNLPVTNALAYFFSTVSGEERKSFPTLTTGDRLPPQERLHRRVRLPAPHTRRIVWFQRASVAMETFAVVSFARRISQLRQRHSLLPFAGFGESKKNEWESWPLSLSLALSLLAAFQFVSALLVNQSSRVKFYKTF